MLTQTLSPSVNLVRNGRVIKYYRASQYGTVREFIHPDSIGDGQIIAQLTGKRTVDSVVRELIRDLTGGSVTFQETVAPLVWNVKTGLRNH